MSNQYITDWRTWVPAVPLDGATRYNVTLPVFDEETTTWKGASEIILQFNYTASRAFYLTSLPTKPIGVNYGLCIRYRVGSTVYRYKLWEDDNFILGENAAPLYNSEVIKPNFVLEVWSLEGETDVTQASAITLFASLRNSTSDLRSSTATALAYTELFTYDDLTFAGTPYNPFGPSLLSTNPDLSWYPSSSIVTSGSPAAVDSWNDTSGNGYDIVNLGAAGKTQPAGWSTFCLQTAANTEISSGAVYGPANICYLLLQLDNNVSNPTKIIAELPCGTQFTQLTDTPTLYAKSAILNSQFTITDALEFNVKYVIKTVITEVAGPATTTSIFIYKLSDFSLVWEGSFSDNGLRSANTGKFAVGDSGGTVVCKIGEAMAYTTAPNHDSVMNHLAQVYIGAVSFATSGTFNVGNMWEDNV